MSKAIVVKWHGPTNTRGSRYSAHAEGCGRVVVSKDYALNPDGNARQALAAFLAKRESSHGWGEPSDYVMGYLPNGGFVFVDKRGA